ncbi:GDSL-type esterase/lipase family protein, partial [Nesterenkonia muleiensis]|uniref:DUF459 domain-containing protein n=1 Tax=Nesterenkonia muleiensis TaxID=2282648 RepID=UPI001EE40F0F
SITLPVAAITAATIGVPQAAGNIDLTVVAIALGLALLAPVLLFVLELAALRRMTTPAFGTLMAIEPAIALLLGLVVLSQMPTVIQCLGIIVVVLAGATAQHGGRREPLANTGAMPIHTQQVEEGSPHNKDATDAVQSSSGNTAAESVQHSAVNTADSSCDEVLRASHEDRSQRQPKASTPTPGPDVRVCFVGDSFVAGTGDPTGLGWVGRVTAQAISRGMRVTTYNLGVRRETSVQISHRILAEVKPRLSDVDAPRVVVSFGVNDTVLEHGQSRVQAHEAVTALVNIHQSLAPLPLLMVGPPAIDDNAQNARLEHLNELLRTTAEAHNIAFIDTFHATVTNHSWRDEVRNGDGYHPSANGYQLLAETVVNPLTDWLHDGNHPEF